MWYGEPNAINNAAGYARFYSRSHDAVIRVYDDAGNVIETHEHAGEFGVADYSELFAGCRPGQFNETRRRRLGRELVDRSVVVLTPMNGGAVKISKLIDDHAVIGKRAIWRALERMNYSLGPLTAAGRA